MLVCVRLVTAFPVDLELSAASYPTPEESALAIAFAASIDLPDLSSTLALFADVRFAKAMILAVFPVPINVLVEILTLGCLAISSTAKPFVILEGCYRS